jgi:predicted 2-oxoglutarate/Fe(II)-dependent dioxygenase YbiX
MSATYLQAVSLRRDDLLLPALSPQYLAIAAALSPVVRSLLVHNADPDSVSVDELLDQLQEIGTELDWARRSDSGITTRSHVLDWKQCAALRAACDAATMEIMDTVDGQLEYQLSLNAAQLEDLIGEATLRELAALAKEHHDSADSSVTAVADAAARLAGVTCTSPALPSKPQYIFVRRYSPATRPWMDFHSDRASITLNIALNAESEHTGGRLLAVEREAVRFCQRTEGTATVHSSRLLHAVSRMTGGVRYSLILFYRPICPDAAHHLVKCNAATMELLYPLDKGSYSCNSCGDSAEMLGHPGMWHCSDGCEYDVCNVCYDYVL